MHFFVGFKKKMFVYLLIYRKTLTYEPSSYECSKIKCLNPVSKNCLNEWDIKSNLKFMVNSEPINIYKIPESISERTFYGGD